MTLTSITVSGTYKEQDGSTDATGSIRFRLSDTLRDSATNVIVSPQDLVKKLVNGSFSTVLVANDDPTTAPTNTVYHVELAIDGAEVERFDITVPYDSAGGVLNMADVVPTTQLPFQNIRFNWYEGQSFGMVPDGDDANPTDNTSAWEAALAAADAAGGGVVHLSAGCYRIKFWLASSALQARMLQNGVAVVGDGKYVTAIKGMGSAVATDLADAGAALRLIGMNSNSRISDLTIDGDKASITRTAGTACVLLQVTQGEDEISIERVRVINNFSSGGEEGWGIGLAQTTRAWITDCEVVDSSGSGMSVSGSYISDLPSSEITIRGCIFKGNKWAGLTIHGSKRVTISGCQFIANGDPNGTPSVHGTGLNIEFASNITVSNCQILNNYMSGVGLLGYCRQVVINGCEIRGTNDTATWSSAQSGAAELRFVNHSWINGGVYYGVPQQITVSNCRVIPKTSGNHIGVSATNNSTDGTSLPQVTLIGCTDEQGRGPEYWTYANISTQNRIALSLDIPTLPRLKEVAVPALDGGSVTRGSSVTVTTATVAGSRAATVYKFSLTTGTATARRTTYTLPDQRGKQYIRFRLMPITTGVPIGAGFFDAGDATYYREFRWTPFSTDTSTWFDVFILGDFGTDTTTDHQFCIQTQLNSACEFYLDGVPMIGTIDGYGAI